MVTKEEWFEMVCESYLNPPVYMNETKLPGFPTDELQISTVGHAGVATLKEGYLFYEDCLEHFQDLSTPIEPHHALLDFGVGWGRMSRFFLRELPLENIYGIDVMESFIEICKTTFNSRNFYVTSPYPVTFFPEKKFNFIIGYSVFSHLSEEACARWMKEFNRILAPGGLVVLTTRGRPFFDYCESLKYGNHTGYSAALARIFEDFDQARARYDQGELVHSNYEGVSGGGAMTKEFYGETFIPEKYAKTAYSDWFVLEKFVFDPSRQPQPIMFFRKK